MFSVSRVKQFRLEQRQIYIRRAFRRATFAGKTIAQRRIQFLRLQWIVAVFAPLQNLPDDVSPTAGGHDFFASREESGAHRGGVLATTATAIALLQIADEVDEAQLVPDFWPADE